MAQLDPPMPVFQQVKARAHFGHEPVTPDFVVDPVPNATDHPPLRTALAANILAINVFGLATRRSSPQPSTGTSQSHVNLAPRAPSATAA
jgi:hypothetical protein